MTRSQVIKVAERYRDTLNEVIVELHNAAVSGWCPCSLYDAGKCDVKCISSLTLWKKYLFRKTNRKDTPPDAELIAPNVFDAIRGYYDREERERKRINNSYLLQKKINMSEEEEKKRYKREIRRKAKK